MLNGIRNFLTFINDNWTAIVIVVSIIITITLKVKSLFVDSTNRQVEKVKAQISEVILKLIADAEIDYKDYAKSGAIKRSQVIQKIFSEYPILSKFTNQDELISWLDYKIINALKELREIIDDHTEEE